MTVNRMAGCCLILFGIINVLHEITVINSGRGKPGVVYAIVTAALFAVGAALLLRPRHRQNETATKRLSKD
jgi:hypothetical protein